MTDRSDSYRYNIFEFDVFKLRNINYTKHQREVNASCLLHFNLNMKEKNLEKFVLKTRIAKLKRSETMSRV